MRAFLCIHGVNKHEQEAGQGPRGILKNQTRAESGVPSHPARFHSGSGRKASADRRYVKKRLLKTAVCLVIAAMLVILDQITKNWAVRVLKAKDDIILIPKVLRFKYLENEGMAFGLLQKHQILFAVMTVIILALVVLILYRIPHTKRFLPANICLTLVIAGAVGNFIDRTAQKYVVDFIYFELINFPVFNVADCYVTVSVFLLAALILFVYKDAELEAVFPFLKEKEKKVGGDGNSQD